MLDLKLKYHDKFSEKIEAKCGNLSHKTAFAVSTILAIMVQDDPNIKIEDIEEFSKQCGDNLFNYLQTLPQTSIQNLGEEQYILLATEALGLKKPNEVKLKEQLEEKDVEEATLEYAIEEIKSKTKAKLTEETSKVIRDSVIDDKKPKIAVEKLQQLLKEIKHIITLINSGKTGDLFTLLKKIKDGQQKKIDNEVQLLSKHIENFKRLISNASKRSNSLFGSITGMLAGAALGIAFGSLSLIAIPALGLAGSIAGKRMGDVFDQSPDLSMQEIFGNFINDIMDNPGKMLSLAISGCVSAALVTVLGPIGLIATPYLLEAGVDVGEELFQKQEMPKELTQFTDTDIDTPDKKEESKSQSVDIAQVIDQTELRDITNQLSGVSHVDEAVEHGNLNPNKSATELTNLSKDDNKELSL